MEVFNYRFWCDTENETPVRLVTDDRAILSLTTIPVKRSAGLLSCPAYFDAPLENHTNSPVSPALTYNRNMALASNSANRRIRQSEPVRIDVYADMVKIRQDDLAAGFKDRAPVGGGIRGKVTGFSRASRKRLIECMASIRNTGSMLFLTMTFDDSSLPLEEDQTERHFEAFRHRFERQYPTWCALWRKEWQDRKSGDFTGTFVPHYHFVIFTGVHYEKESLESVSECFRVWGSAAWQEITSSTDKNHLIYGYDVSPIRTRKHAYSYVAKYIAKQTDKSFATGRAWGRIGKLNCTISASFSLEADEIIVFRRLVKKWLKTRVATPPESASPEEVEKWLIRLKKQRQFCGSFARISAGTGFTIFGIGDFLFNTGGINPPENVLDFVTESHRQVRERRERERGYGN